ncbi:MAG: hypothetical protein KGN02_13390 [bacterium]|nr:hypothetical protein [bacterium]
MRGGQRLDLGIYARAFAYLATHPSILALPLLAAVVDVLFSHWSGMVTDPLGGLGNGIFQMIVQIVYLFAFGVAVIQANNVARGYKSGFDDAWEEGRRKASGIILAAIGFQFLAFAAAYIGSIAGGIVSIVLQLVAYFFLILTIPAAAIGGLPGSLAISGSFRAVRDNVVPCIVLAVVFVIGWILVPQWFTVFVGAHLGLFGYEISLALVRAIVLAYLAFPFAVTYDSIAFRGFW